MFRRLLQSGLVCFIVFLILPAPALGGTANDPEIVSPADSTMILRGDVIPHLEITKGWIEAEKVSRGDDRFRFVLEVASLPPLKDIPKDAVYTFHYTIPEIGRLYWRANWSADATDFQSVGGVYSGCVPSVCPGYDDQGNRNYMYIPGNQSQMDRTGLEVIPGAPGRIVWSYPQEGYSDRLHGLEMKGLFAATYTKSDNGPLRFADIAQSAHDFIHTVKTPWHERLLAQIPGPSPLLVGVAVIGALAFASRLRLRDE